MTISEKLRNKIFWLADFLNGGAVKEQFSQIEKVFAAPNELDQYTQAALASLLNYASKNTDFYQGFKGKCIEEFPIIDKNLIRANTERFYSALFKPEERIPATTSGSTGTPFTVFHSRQKKFGTLRTRSILRSLEDMTLAQSFFILKYGASIIKRAGCSGRCKTLKPSMY